LHVIALQATVMFTTTLTVWSLKKVVYFLRCRNWMFMYNCSEL